MVSEENIFKDIKSPIMVSEKMINEIVDVTPIDIGLWSGGLTTVHNKHLVYTPIIQTAAQ